MSRVNIKSIKDPMPSDERKVRVHSGFMRLCKRFDMRLDHEEIDEFLDHLNVSVKRRVKKLEQEYKDLSEGQFQDERDMEPYRDHLVDLIESSKAAKKLGDELSIIALCKKVETHTGQIVKKKIETANGKKISFFKTFSDVLPFKIEEVNGFSSFNELRLISNAIKHDDGKVSAELAGKFDVWKLGDDLSNMDDVFERLLPGVKEYVADLVEKLYEFEANNESISSAS
jgi:hypothetical protein